MTHLELENLASEYLEGQLDAARRSQVEVHLGGCASCRELMGDHTNSLGFNIVAWGASIIMIILTLVLLYAQIFQPSAIGLYG